MMHMTQLTISRRGTPPRHEASKPMEFLLLILALVIGLAVLDATAAEVGVDSRFDIDDSHAPLHGAY